MWENPNNFRPVLNPRTLTQFLLLDPMFQYIYEFINVLVMRWAGHVKCMGEIRNALKIFVGMSEGWRQVGRRRRIWENNVKMDLK
jgi:hypothetical protein